MSNLPDRADPCPPDDTIRQFEGRYRSLVEAIADGIILQARGGEILMWNPAAERVFGIGAAAAVGRTSLNVAWQTYRPDGTIWPGHEHPSMVTLRTGQPCKDILMEVRTEAGQRTWVTVNTVPVFRSGDHEPDAVVISFTDITAHRAAEEALRLSESRFRTLFELAGAGMAVVETMTGLFVQVNDAFCQLLGYTGEELTRTTVLAVTHPADLEETQRQFTALIAGAVRDHAFRKRYIHKSGRTVWVDLSFAPLWPPDHRPDFHVIVVIDVTDRERATSELRASQFQLRALAARLEEAREAERSHVAREIHDVLAQDLTRLKIDLSRLRGRLRKFGDDADDLRAQVAAMSSLADTAISNVQRIATELRPPVLDSLGLSAAVDWHAREFQDRAGLVCRVSVPDEEPVIDRSVATAVFRILQESLTNVVRHADASVVDISLAFGDGVVALTVRDNGRGISRQEVSDASSIGIAGMRERATLLGGRFAVTSEPGAGTLVDVRIPHTG
jgi:two-component system, NarL family, sensor histidine kinase UhpB